MRTSLALVSVVSSLLSGAAFAGDGLAAPSAVEVWPQWQARITVSTTTLAPVTLLGSSDAMASRPTLQSGALFGDYYVDVPMLRVPSLAGGLRATGGLLVGPRGLALGSAPQAWRNGRLGLVLQNGIAPPAVEAGSDTVPYIGLGYTGLAWKGGWGVSADLGLVAERPGAGRALFGNSGWDSTLREMRISPVLQLGVSYAF